MSDLVHRLQYTAGEMLAVELFHEAADRIEALEAALREIAAHSSLHDAIAERIARRALESKTV
jgi:hypothetical protein